MTIAYPLGLVLDDEGAAARLVLRRDPLGQRSVWQLRDWMQPSSNMNPRAELHQSAPSVTAMPNELTILPEQPMRILSLAPMPISVPRTKTRP
jgi:hypothetical protein